MTIDRTRYEVAQVFSGGFGTVYEILNCDKNSIDPILNTPSLQDHYHEVHRSRLAAKTLQERYDSKLFANECLLHLPLRHPGITPILAVRNIEGSIFALMPFRDCTLKELVGRVDSLVLIKSICRCLIGMDYAHSTFGLVHHDIKPDNILVSITRNEPIMEVSDWGIAKSVTGEITGNSGTLPYIAPGRFSNSTPSLQDDIFSFGIVFFQLITGSLPYRRNIREELVNWSFYDVIIENAQMLDRKLRSLILNSTNPDPERRTSSYGDLIKEINKL